MCIVLKTKLVFFPSFICNFFQMRDFLNRVRACAVIACDVHCRMYSEDLLWRVVWMMLLSIKPNDISVLLHLSLATVYRVWAYYQQYGVVRKQMRSVKLSGYTLEDAAFVDKMVATNPELFLDEYCDLFTAERGKSISASVLLRIFHVGPDLSDCTCSHDIVS